MNFIQHDCKERLNEVELTELESAKATLLQFCRLNIDTLRTEFESLDPTSVSLESEARQMLTAMAHWKQLLTFIGDLNNENSRL